MKILFLEWNSYGNEDLIEAMKEAAIDVVRYPISSDIPRRHPDVEKKLLEDFEEYNPDLIFSFNYFPIISTVCNTCNKTYISWVYDSPHATIYSYTVINPCNRVLLFDRAEYLKFAGQGIKTVGYMPLAANPKRIQKLIVSAGAGSPMELSFIGSLYNEEHDILKHLKPSPDGVETEAWLNQEYVTNRKLTSIERIALLNAGAEICDTHLFTKSSGASLSPKVKLHGPVDYYDQAPICYHSSQINLCPTLKSIHSGIPLRVFDIMASKGLLLMNHQTDMDEFFVEGEDYYTYSSVDDFKNKVKFLLDTDTTRVTESAYNKLLSAHTYAHRLKSILDLI